VALGLTPPSTLNDIRVQTLQELKAHAASRREDLTQGVDYRLLAALTEHRNLAFLALGRPEEQGCYCPVQSVLKRSLEVLAAQFDLTLVDAEAGVEQINRDVLGPVDTLLLVMDTSVKALRVAETVRDVARRQQSAREILGVVNRARDRAEVDELQARTDLEIMGHIPEDEEVHRFDAEAHAFFELPPCPATAAVEGLLARLGLSAP
jgi:CO dehydrogenase maturation factor